MNKRAAGTRYEEIAAQFLRSRGFDIWERNYRCRAGEIDIIAMDGSDGTICFTEVKYRSSDRYGMPAEAVSAEKQRRIIAVSAYYLKERGLIRTEDGRTGRQPGRQTAGGLDRGVRYRYDVVEILGDRIRLIPNAFGAGAWGG